MKVQHKNNIIVKQEYDKQTFNKVDFLDVAHNKKGEPHWLPFGYFNFIYLKQYYSPLPPGPAAPAAGAGCAAIHSSIIARQSGVARSRAERPSAV